MDEFYLNELVATVLFIMVAWGGLWILSKMGDNDE